MVKKNYAAWNINSSEFSHDWPDSKKLEFFARYAVLAPSGHNTQPWQLNIKNNLLVVSINPAHHLSIDGSGLLSVEPYISLGTFLEVFQLASKGFGYDINLDLFPKGEQIAAIYIKSETTPQPDLLKAILTRVSSRTPFEKTPLDKNVVDQITKHNLSGIAITIITDRSDIEFLAQQTERAIKSIMSNPLYRKELSAWVRTNHTRKYDGMPGFTHGFGNFKALLSKTAVRHAPNQGPQAKKSGNLIRMSGSLIIVRCSDSRKESFINAGRLYSRMCVLATNAGLATSALGASVLDASTRKEVQKHFSINDRPIYMLRLGKGKIMAKHSPRWPLEKVLTRVTS